MSNGLKTSQSHLQTLLTALTMACGRSTKTALSQYAEESQSDSSFEEVQVLYPMYTLPMEKFFLMTVVRPHEELLSEGQLVEYSSDIGKSMFVSHQWLSDAHPDPHGEQLKVLQEALQNVISGAVKALTHFTVELVRGRIHAFTSAELKTQPIFLWYDFCSCPQLSERWGEAENCTRSDSDQSPVTVRSSKSSKSMTDNPFRAQQRAIASIPYYVQNCHFFIALCPMLQDENSATLNRYTWAERGWCRAEKMVRELSNDDGLVLMVQSPTHLTFMPAWESFVSSPGDGQFTEPQDLMVVSQMLQKLLVTKLKGFLKRRQLHKFRFFLNQQRTRFRNCPLALVNGLLVDAGTSDIVGSFLLQNGFETVHDRDKEGWSPLCYAAMNGEPELIEGLLLKLADPNDSTHKQDQTGMMLPKGTPVVSLCATFTNNEALKVLLRARADPNKRDGMSRSTPLFYTAYGDNVEAIDILMEFGADPHLKHQAFADIALDVASALGSRRVVEKLLQITPPSPHLLHFAVMVDGGHPRLVQTLIDSKVNINEEYAPAGPSAWRMKLLYHFFTAKHIICGASIFSSISYHHRGATPLMLSFLSGHFAAAEVLLDAGARLHLQNSRGRTALDFAMGNCAPASLLQRMQGIQALPRTELSTPRSLDFEGLAPEIQEQINEECITCSF